MLEGRSGPTPTPPRWGVELDILSPRGFLPVFRVSCSNYGANMKDNDAIVLANQSMSEDLLPILAKEVCTSSELVERTGLCDTSVQSALRKFLHQGWVIRRRGRGPNGLVYLYATKEKWAKLESN